MKAELVPIETLRTFEGNPRRGNVEVIQESLRTHGQYRPIVVRTETREVLAGNHTMQAAIAEGWDEIWATFVECDDQTAKKINLIDNRAPELGGYDGEALTAMLQALPDLEGTGWSTDDLQSLLYKLEPAEEDSPPGNGDSGNASAQLAVIIICVNPHHQSRVLKELLKVQAGDEVQMGAVLRDAQIQAVTV